MKRIDFLGIPLDIFTLEHTLNKIDQSISQKKQLKHVVVNVAKLVYARQNSFLKSSILKSDIVNIDGFGIIFGLRLFGYHGIGRVTGIDLFFRLISLASKKGYPIFLLGAKDEVLDLTKKNLLKNYPNLNISGSNNGYFTKNEEESIVQKINKSKAKILFVAISSPKKELFLEKWKSHLNANLLMGVGGTFDIVSGKKNRAPLWMQNIGLEWFYRMMQEPRRMTKRYIYTNIFYMILLFKEFFKKGPEEIN